MKMSASTSLLVALLVFSSCADSQNAVRQGDFVGFFCFVNTGNENVTVAGAPMAAEGDSVGCPGTCPDGVSPVEGTLSGGSSSVFVNGRRAAVSGESIGVDACIDLGEATGWPFVEVGL
jgi:uncharacterized Zn-binding protein involved in type VI secretion